MKAVRLSAALALAAFALAALADGPQDNVPEKVRPIPPDGIELKKADVIELKQKLDELGKAIAALPAKLKGKPALIELIPDVEVFHKAVEYAMQMNTFYAAADVARAKKQLDLGLERARLLADGKPTWTTATGLVVRGFRSRIDGSVQPYGLVVPASYRPDGPHKHRLDVWLHGRGEKSLEVQFIDERMRSSGRFTPRDAFVVHPFGRYCNAFKFAGEIDVLEAVAHVKRHYSIDDDRLVMRGFSMGGAGCWQFAVHYPDRWCAAAPGAGFSETPLFLKVFQDEKLKPPSYEKALWQLYDCDGYAANLYNLPTVAYSGDKDKQKQAADVMEAALKKRGIDLVHVIGKDVGHDYTAQAKAEIDRRLDRLAARGRDHVPARVIFTTPTLRYNRSFWVRIDGLTQHWKSGTVIAEVHREGRIEVQTSGVEGVSLVFASGEFPLAFASNRLVEIDGKVFSLPLRSDRSLTVSLHRGNDGKWAAGPVKGEGLRKRPGLQGPIDDAFLDRFIFVRPTGKAMNEKTEAWVKAEMERAIREWRRHFRGEAIVKDDKDVTEADLASSNVVLWGDPSSNLLLKKMADKLPIAWDEKQIDAGKTFDASTHVLSGIHPNPLSPTRYVVLNSGFTFREYDYLNNARQTPKLPDYAVIDVSTPPSSQWPGKVAAAGFFDEQWRLPKAK